MSAIPERFGSLTAAIATAVRQGDEAKADRWRAELRTAKLAAKIREAVAATPPLSEDQLAYLRSLLGVSS